MHPHTHALPSSAFQRSPKSRQRAIYTDNAAAVANCRFWYWGPQARGQKVYSQPCFAVRRCRELLIDLCLYLCNMLAVALPFAAHANCSPNFGSGQNACGLISLCVSECVCVSVVEGSRFTNRQQKQKHCHTIIEQHSADTLTHTRAQADTNSDSTQFQR